MNDEYSMEHLLFNIKIHEDTMKINNIHKIIKVKIKKFKKKKKEFWQLPFYLVTLQNFLIIMYTIQKNMKTTCILFKHKYSMYTREVSI